jgi:hypothetical protein
MEFAERALALLLAHWKAVEAVAAALIEDRRVEGDRVEQIIRSQHDLVRVMSLNQGGAPVYVC